jgi:DNA polymerase-3 subunit epsilon
MRVGLDPPDTPLAEVTFVVLDLETTGATAAGHAITEIGAVKYRGGERLGVYETLVNPGEPIPAFITALTGITETMVGSAPGVGALLPSLLEFIGGAVIVGHNVRFDMSFLGAALDRRGRPALDHHQVDTLGIARRLLRDEVPDFKLTTLARHLQTSVDPCHRALADAQATADVLHALLERAGTLGVLGLDDLLALPSMHPHPCANKLRLTARTPRRPGVYRFRGRTGRVLYVGHAANLRERVRSHFHGEPRRKVPQLLRETEAIDWTECVDERDALAQEARLVAELRPRYNRDRGTRS